MVVIKRSLKKMKRQRFIWLAALSCVAYTILLSATGTAQPLVQELLDAAQVGDLATVVRAIDSGASIESTDQNGETALIRAIQCRRYQVIDWLLAHGASANHPDKYGLTPLMWASSRGGVEVVKRVLAAKPDLSAKDSNGRTALECAISSRDVASVDALLVAGLFKERNFLGWPLLAESAELDIPEPIMERLIQAGARVNARGRMGRTALMEASGRENADTIKMLLSHGAEVDLTDEEGLTALAHAVKNCFDENSLQAVNALLAAGADPNLPNTSYAMAASVLKMAVLRWNVGLIKALLVAGADPNSVDGLGSTVVSDCPPAHKQELLRLIMENANGAMIAKGRRCGPPLLRLSWNDPNQPPLSVQEIACPERGITVLCEKAIEAAISGVDSWNKKSYEGKSYYDLAKGCTVYSLDFQNHAAWQFCLIPVNLHNSSFYLLARKAKNGEWEDVSRQLGDIGKPGGYELVSSPILLDLDCDGVPELLLRALDNGVKYAEGAGLHIFCCQGSRLIRLIDKDYRFARSLTDFLFERPALDAHWTIAASTFVPDDWKAGPNEDDGEDESSPKTYTRMTFVTENCTLKLIKSEEKNYGPN